MDVFTCNDGHVQERALLGAAADSGEPDEVWVAKCNFCVLGFLHGIERRPALFIIRPDA